MHQELIILAQEKEGIEAELIEVINSHEELLSRLKKERGGQVKAVTLSQQLAEADLEQELNDESFVLEVVQSYRRKWVKAFRKMILLFVAIIYLPAILVAIGLTLEFQPETGLFAMGFLLLSGILLFRWLHRYSAKAKPDVSWLNSLVGCKNYPDSWWYRWFGKERLRRMTEEAEVEWKKRAQEKYHVAISELATESQKSLNAIESEYDSRIADSSDRTREQFIERRMRLNTILSEFDRYPQTCLNPTVAISSGQVKFSTQPHSVPFVARGFHALCFENLSVTITQLVPFGIQGHLFVSTTKSAARNSDGEVIGRDELFEDAARLVVSHQQCSASLLQRKLQVGYHRTNRLLDQLEDAGLIGPFDGSKFREVLVYDEESLAPLLIPGDYASTIPQSEVRRVVDDLIWRQLLGVKPAKIKLILFDPIEQGAFFSSFHGIHREVSGGVVYYSEEELNDILDALLRQIAMVVQKLLQNKYESLEEYNAENADVAEPLKLVVLRDFPSNFSQDQSMKLNQIMGSAAKCGIYFIFSGNPDSLQEWIAAWQLKQLLQVVSPSDYESTFAHFNGDQMLREFNDQVDQAENMLVSVRDILQEQDHWWGEDSSSKITLPIGRRGREIQALQFDNQDDNQALLIGKPGSGKSNLLHVIILSAITRYGPDELEIYLIDFKGGVEFSIYAEHIIPHLKTVALESDREFGLSVIDGVEQTLLERERMFARVGAQDIAQYNEQHPDQKLPRILFIVDEFQEFFNHNDDLKDEVSRKYDRIIRKGRAFGINSLFSSQTLDGASIPSSTKELIDIRIALMCGDNDVTAIMDGSNKAAKDLTRPGEGIYNAENGKTPGNQKFQAVFVERQETIRLVKKVADLGLARGVQGKKRFIFRGDQKAFIESTQRAVNQSDSKAFRYKTVRMWLGEPTKMADDIHLDFKFSMAQNLLVMAAEKEAARVLGAFIYALNKQQEKLQQAYVINPLSEVDEGFQDFTNAYGTAVTEISPSRLEPFLNELKVKLDERVSNPKERKGIFVVMNSIQRMRSLRRDTRDFEVPTLFNTLLADGPEVGIFFIVHVDAMPSLGRTEVQPRDFVHRVSFAANDDQYYNLFNTSNIAPLKRNRAIYYDDELGQLSTFKPYELAQNN